MVFVVYLAGVGLSALGLTPLSERAVSMRILVVAVLAALIILGVPTAVPPSLLVLSGRAHGGGPSAKPAASVAAPVLGGLRALCWSVLSAGLLLSLAAWLLAWWLPVGAYDALGYRLPAVAQWLDAGAVSWVVGDDPLRNGYPLGLEVVEAVVFRALGSARAVDCVATSLVLAGAATLAGFARQLGVQRAPAALVAGLFLL
ncbi:MAG: hypothetical protein RLZZ450_7701, partial [Pseudomonadota bacterium]